MKKKKFLCIILLCMFLTGCSTNYEIEIYNDIVKENITIDYPEAVIEGTTPLEYSEKQSIKYFESTDVLFSRKWTEKDNLLLSKEVYTFQVYQDNLAGLSTCYDLYKLNDYDDTITLLTSDVFKCFDIYPELDKVTLKIKSNHKMLDSNADRQEKHTYYWDIDKTNYQNKKISLKLASDKYVFNYNNEFVKKIIYIVIIVGIILGVIGSIYSYFDRKNKNANKI